MATTLSTAQVQQLAQAIERAEDGASNGSNNPGSLKLGDVGHGYFNSEGVTQFGSLQDGWTALYNQIDLIFAGGSAYYTPSTTIAQMGATWAGAARGATWAATVAGALGVSVNTTLAQWAAGNPGVLSVVPESEIPAGVFSISEDGASVSPVPPGYPTGEIFTDGDGNEWEYESGEWVMLGMAEAPAAAAASATPAASSSGLSTGMLLLVAGVVAVVLFLSSDA